MGIIFETPSVVACWMIEVEVYTLFWKFEYLLDIISCSSLHGYIVFEHVHGILVQFSVSG